jgi:hypothetical protein
MAPLCAACAKFAPDQALRRCRPGLGSGVAMRFANTLPLPQ